MPLFNPPQKQETTYLRYIISIGKAGTGKTYTSCSMLYPGEKNSDGSLSEVLFIDLERGASALPKRYKDIITIVPFEYNVRIGTDEWYRLPAAERFDARRELDELINSIRTNTLLGIDLNKFKLIVFDGAHEISDLIDDYATDQFGIVDLTSGSNKTQSKYRMTGDLHKDFFRNKLKNVGKYIVITIGETKDSKRDKENNIIKEWSAPAIVGGFRNKIPHTADIVIYTERAEELVKGKTKYRMLLTGDRQRDGKVRLDFDDIEGAQCVLEDTFGEWKNCKLYVLRHAMLFNEWRPDITWDKLTPEQQRIVNSDPQLRMDVTPTITKTTTDKAVTDKLAAVQAVAKSVKEKQQATTVSAKPDATPKLFLNKPTNLNVAGTSVEATATHDPKKKTTVVNTVTDVTKAPNLDEAIKLSNQTKQKLDEQIREGAVEVEKKPKLDLFSK